MSNSTPFGNKCDILTELWLDYREEEDFQDFFDYSDLGCPLAYAVSNNIVKPTPQLISLVEETFDVLTGALGVNGEEEEFETLEQLFEASDKE